MGLGRGVHFPGGPHPPCLEALRPHCREHPDPRAALPARQREVLGNHVHGIGGGGAGRPPPSPPPRATRPPPENDLPPPRRSGRGGGRNCAGAAAPTPA